jgi:hypothetical protein
MTIENNLLIGSQIATAIGTLILAGVTYKTVRQSKEQLKLLKEQTRRLKHDKPLLLKLIRYKVEKNHIKLDLENIGEQSIFQIGLETRFTLAVPHVEKRGKQNFISFSFDPSQLIDDFDGKKRKIFDNGFVNWNTNKNRIVLRPKEIISLEFVPKFNFFYYKEGKFMLGTNGRSLTFDQLIEIMKKNNKRFFGIECSIVFKNYLDEFQEPIELFNFVFDIENHKTIEDCVNQKFKAQYHALSSQEIETILDGIDTRMYNGMTNPRKSE